jgi:hypothetical protein
MQRIVRITTLVVVGLAVIGTAGLWWLRSKQDKEPMFHTVPVRRGDLVARSAPRARSSRRK